MSLVHYIVAIPSEKLRSCKDRRLCSPHSPVFPLASFRRSSTSPLLPKSCNFISRWLRTSTVKVNAKSIRSELSSPTDAITNFKHILLPITNRNPFLSDGTREAIATAAALGNKCGADITVLVIDQKEREYLPNHEDQLSSIRSHLSEGGFQEFRLLERLGERNKPSAIIGDIAEDLKSDLVVLSMEDVHSKNVDANLLVEFIPCPILLLPL